MVADKGIWIGANRLRLVESPVEVVGTPLGHNGIIASDDCTARDTAVSRLSALPPQKQEGSPTSSALETVLASDARIARLQREAEILEEDADGAANTTPATTGSRLPMAKGKSAPTSSLSPPAPPPSAAGLMDGLREELSRLSVEEKVSRLEEVYVDLDALVRSEDLLAVCWEGNLRVCRREFSLFCLRFVQNGASNLEAPGVSRIHTNLNSSPNPEALSVDLAAFETILSVCVRVGHPCLSIPTVLGCRVSARGIQVLTVGMIRSTARFWSSVYGGYRVSTVLITACSVYRSITLPPSPLCAPRAQQVTCFNRFC